MKPHQPRKPATEQCIVEAVRRTRPPKRAGRRVATTAQKESARALLPLALRALAHPGLPRASVFTGAPGVHAYYVDATDPAFLIQEAEDGTKVTGKMVGDRFEPI